MRKLRWKNELNVLSWASGKAGSQTCTCWIPEAVNLNVAGPIFKILSGIDVYSVVQLAFPGLSFTLLDYKFLGGRHHVSFIFLSSSPLLVCLIHWWTMKEKKKLMRYLLSVFAAPVIVGCMISLLQMNFKNNLLLFFWGMQIETMKIVLKFLDDRTFSGCKSFKWRNGKFRVVFLLDAFNFISKVAVG